MNFIPVEEEASQEIIFFDDATAASGWVGHTTRKSLDLLKQEVREALERLGCEVNSFQRGGFLTGGYERDGFRVHFLIKRAGGEYLPGQLDIVALPVKKDPSLRRTYETRKEKSLKMALYMLRDALKGQWYFKQLSNDYAPLMPFMLGPKGKTLSHMWLEANDQPLLMASIDADFIEVEDGS